jgi:hypothetical protein
MTLLRAWKQNGSGAFRVSNQGIGSIALLTMLLLALPTGAPAQIRINEFMAANGATTSDLQGQFADWIELYNAGLAPVDVGGLFMTDDLTDPSRYQIPTGYASQTTIPSHGYLVLWADNDTVDGPRHLGFRLNADLDAVGLFAAGGVPIDSISFDNQKRDISYGRFPDGGAEWRFYSPASPARANVGGFQGRVLDVQFSVPHGVYGSAFSVALSCPTPGAQIFYTTDFSDPTQSSAPYTVPIPVSQTTIIRARAYKTNWIPSDVKAQTYLFLNSTITQSYARAVADGFPANWTPSISLPGTTISGDYEVDPAVVTDPAYSDELTTALTKLPTLSVSMPIDSWLGYNNGLISNSDRADQQGWERACTAELFYPDGRPGFTINCGISLIGGTSPDLTAGGYKSPKHSFRLLFKDLYGPTHLKTNAPLFPGSRLETFNTIVLDARMNNAWHYSGGVSPATQRLRAQYLRDHYVNDMQNKPGDLSPHSMPAHLYFNGLYWGMYITHERPDDEFMADYWGGDPLDYDSLKHNSSWVLAGTNADYLAMFNLARLGMADQARYQQVITQYLDLDPFINYMLLNFWVGNTDWAHQNWYAGRNRLDGSLFRYYSWDAEHVLENAGDNVVGKNDPGGPTELHQLLLQNSEYKMHFIDRAQKLMKNGGLFTSGPARAMYNFRANEIFEPVIMESARWGDRAQDYVPQPPPIPLYTRDGFWIPERDRIVGTLLRDRANTTLGQLRTAGVFPTLQAPTYNINGAYQHGGTIASGAALTMVNPNAGGTIYYTLDGSDPRVPVTGAVSPAARNYGTNPPGALTDTTWVRARVLNATWSAMNDAVYRLNTSDYNALRITEVMYNPAPPLPGYFGNDDFEFIEVKNTGAVTLDLRGVSLDDGVYFTFHDSDIVDAQLLAPGQSVVVVSHEIAFRQRYGDQVRVAGRYFGSLDNAGERIRLISPSSTTIVQFEYNDAREWPQAANGAGHSLVPLDSALAAQPAGSCNYGGSWRASTYLYGSPGRDDPAVPAAAPNGVVLNEFAAHTDYTPAPPDSNDWIEIHNPTAGDIVLNNCYLSDDIQNLAKWQIPNGTLIRAGARLSFDEITHFNNPTGVGFGLNKDGEHVVLSYLPGTTATRVLDEVRFKGQENGVTLGRYGDGVTAAGPAVGSWRPMLPTRDNPNSAPIAEPIINQFMYHPNDHTTASEYIEFYNPTAAPIDLWNAAGAWRISGGVDFDFTTSVTLPAGGYLLLLPFHPANTTALDAFKAKYGVTTFPGQLYGPWSGSLSDVTERIALERPQAPDLPGQPRSWVIVDETFYFHQAPFPTSPAGGGNALYRVAPNTPGPAPTSWTDASPNLTHSGVSGPLVINQAATGITSRTASLNGEVTSTGGENPTVRIYWGATDGGASTASWTNVVNLGARGLGAYSTPVSSLTTSTLYYFRAHAQNSAGGTWAPAAASFTTRSGLPDAPTVSLSAATSITQNAARLNGAVVATGGENPAVRFYYGPADGGKVESNWPNYRAMGTLGAGPFFADLTGLSPSTRFYFQVFASNSGGPAWATASGTFLTSAPAVTPPGIATISATGITYNSATLMGQVTSNGGQNPTVRVYYGTTTGGSVPGNWQFVKDLGVQGVGFVSTAVTSLTASTPYFYRFYAENSAGGTWAAATGSFTTSNPPIVAPTLAATTVTAVTHSAATLGGAVVATGGENPTVRVYWGRTDAGQVAVSWEHVELLGQRGVGAFVVPLNTLAPNTDYFYRVYGQNSAGGAWSAALRFTTPPDPFSTRSRQWWHLR